MLEQMKERAKQSLVDVYALMLAYKDKRVPWSAKIIAACVVGYAFSPIDLIPDFIPILGQLDDLLLIPLGVTLSIKLIPKDVLVELKEEARKLAGQGTQKNWVAGGIIMGIWLLIIIAIIFKVKR